MRLALFCLLLVLSGAGAARAQGAAPAASCTAAPQIVSLAKLVLDRRGQAPRLAARRYGARSAYLLMRYGGLDAASGQALAGQLADAGVHHAADLAAALKIAGGAWEGMAETAAGRVPLVSAMRQLALSPGRDALFDQLARLEPERRLPAEARLAIALLDRPAAETAALAAAALARGLPGLAGALAIGSPDADAWPQVSAQMTAPVREALVRQWYWLPALHGRADLPREGLSSDPLSAGMRRDMATVWSLALRGGESDWILTYVNQTGDAATAAAAAPAIRAAFEARAPDPQRDPAAAWVLAWRELERARRSAPSIDATLNSLDFAPLRHTRGRAAAVIGWAVTAQALAPSVLGGSPSPDAAPATPAGQGPDWAAMREVARRLAGSSPPPAFETAAARAMAAELLFAAGRTRDLASLMASIPDAEQAVDLARDFALRLDRQCAGYLTHPGDAVLLAGEPLFKF